MRERLPYFPIFLDLRGKDVLIVGGGEVAARKMRSLIESGAKVTVVAPEVAESITQRSQAGDVNLLVRSFDTTDVDGKALVIAATNSAVVNSEVLDVCRARGVWTNVVDDPERCDFIVPAVVHRGSIQVAISTGGASPALARDLRRALETALGPEWGEASEWLAALRTAAKRALPTDHHRREFFEAVLATGLVGLLAGGRRDDARDAVIKVCLERGVSAEELPKD